MDGVSVREGASCDSANKAEAKKYQDAHPAPDFICNTPIKAYVPDSEWSGSHPGMHGDTSIMPQGGCTSVSTFCDQKEASSAWNSGGNVGAEPSHRGAWDNDNKNENDDPGWNANTEKGTTHVVPEAVKPTPDSSGRGKVDEEGVAGLTLPPNKSTGTNGQQRAVPADEFSSHGKPPKASTKTDARSKTAAVKVYAKTDGVQASTHVGDDVGWGVPANTSAKTDDGWGSGPDAVKALINDTGWDTPADTSAGWGNVPKMVGNKGWYEPKPGGSTDAGWGGSSSKQRAPVPGWEGGGSRGKDPQGSGGWLSGPKQGKGPQGGRLEYRGGRGERGSPSLPQGLSYAAALEQALEIITFSASSASGDPSTWQGFAKRASRAVRTALQGVLQYWLQEEFQEDWLFIASVKPPWGFEDVLNVYDKHFGQRLKPRIRSRMREDMLGAPKVLRWDPTSVEVALKFVRASQDLLQATVPPKANPDADAIVAETVDGTRVHPVTSAQACDVLREGRLEADQVVVDIVLEVDSVFGNGSLGYGRPKDTGLRKDSGGNGWPTGGNQKGGNTSDWGSGRGGGGRGKEGGGRTKNSCRENEHCNRRNDWLEGSENQPHRNEIQRGNERNDRGMSGRGGGQGIGVDDGRELPTKGGDACSRGHPQNVPLGYGRQGQTADGWGQGVPVGSGNRGVGTLEDCGQGQGWGREHTDGRSESRSQEDGSGPGKCIPRNLGPSQHRPSPVDAAYGPPCLGPPLGVDGHDPQQGRAPRSDGYVSPRQGDDGYGPPTRHPTGGNARRGPPQSPPPFGNDGYGPPQRRVPNFGDNGYGASVGGPASCAYAYSGPQRDPGEHQDEYCSPKRGTLFDEGYGPSRYLPGLDAGPGSAGNGPLQGRGGYGPIRHPPALEAEHALPAWRGPAISNDRHGSAHQGPPLDERYSPSRQAAGLDARQGPPRRVPLFDADDYGPPWQPPAHRSDGYMSPPRGPPMGSKGYGPVRRPPGQDDSYSPPMRAPAVRDDGYISPQQGRGFDDGYAQPRRPIGLDAGQAPPRRGPPPGGARSGPPGAAADRMPGLDGRLVMGSSPGFVRGEHMDGQFRGGQGRIAALDRFSGGPDERDGPGHRKRLDRDEDDAAWGVSGSPQPGVHANCDRGCPTRMGSCRGGPDEWAPCRPRPEYHGEWADGRGQAGPELQGEQADMRGRLAPGWKYGGEYGRSTVGQGDGMPPGLQLGYGGYHHISRGYVGGRGDDGVEGHRRPEIRQDQYNDGRGSGMVSGHGEDRRGDRGRESFASQAGVEHIGAEIGGRPEGYRGPPEGWSPSSKGPKSHSGGNCDYGRSGVGSGGGGPPSGAGRGWDGPPGAGRSSVHEERDRQTAMDRPAGPGHMKHDSRSGWGTQDAPTAMGMGSGESRPPGGGAGEGGGSGWDAKDAEGPPRAGRMPAACGSTSVANGRGWGNPAGSAPVHTANGQAARTTGGAHHLTDSGAEGDGWDTPGDEVADSGWK